MHTAPALSVVADTGPLPYDFDEGFELLLVYHLVNDSQAWASLGPHVDPRCIRDQRARDVLIAARTFYDRVGRGPGGIRVVGQVLREVVAEGKQTLAWLAEREDLLDEVAEVNDPLPAARDVVAAAVEVVRRRAVGDAVQDLVKDFARRADVDKSLTRVQAARKIGLSTRSRGLGLGDETFDAIDQLRYQDFLTCGIPEVDLAVGGGTGRGQFLLFIAGTGGGKSLYLSALAAAALAQGKNVLYATLELPEAVVGARVIANLTGEYTNDIVAGQHQRAKQLLAGIPRGRFKALDFAPLVTTVDDIEGEVEALEDEWGEAVDLVIADSLDDVRTSDPRVPTHEAMKLVYTAFRDHGRRRNRWGATASQATRGGQEARKDSKIRIDLGDVADSMHKVRLPDFILTGSLSDDNSTIGFYVAKNRNGVARIEYGPFPTDLARARLVPDLHSWATTP